MKYTFKDITDASIYDSSDVLFVVGQHNIFNNIAIDTLKELCRPEAPAKINDDLLGDFGEELGEVNISNVVDFDTFTKVVNLACMSGKWFCNANYSFLSKKQKDWLNNYIKSPLSNGKLSVYCTDFKDYRFLLKQKTILMSRKVNILQLGFPSREALETIVRGLFSKHGVSIETKAVELFIMRMSSSYDDYDEVVEKIIASTVSLDMNPENRAKYTITYEDTLSAMKGIENFILDDFLQRLLIPLSSDKTNGKNKIYKMLSALLEEFGAVQLVNKLKYKIDDYLEFRIAINAGIIPVKVRFSVPEAKDRLDEDSKLRNISEFMFRRMATIASQTSLKDWSYMKLILDNVNIYDKSSYERALYSLINRSVLNKSRINNDIGVENVLNIDLINLDKQSYKEELLLYNNQGSV